MVMRFATARDKFFFAITVCAIFIYGATRPLLSLMFGQVSGGVNDAAHKSDHKTWEKPVRMIIIGVFAGFFRFIQVSGLEVFAFSTTHKIKLQYFKAIMGKDS
jgi:hypothetical protein